MKGKLEIKDLHVEIDGKEILKGINLELNLGEVIALMGPNGSGKSTLANTIMGNPKYKITKGKILIDGKNIANMPANERSKKGLFMSFQYPAEISGVTLSSFLRTALNARLQKKIGVIEFHNLLKEKMKEIGMDTDFSKRHLNEGFSGGEKKRAEILQMSILKPRFALLDETDSGLDVDALRAVAEGINKLKNKENGILIITHYNRILEYIVPDRVILMKDGKIFKEGGRELAQEVEKEGFTKIRDCQNCEERLFAFSKKKESLK